MRNKWQSYRLTGKYVHNYHKYKKNLQYIPIKSMLSNWIFLKKGESNYMLDLVNS